MKKILLLIFIIGLFVACGKPKIDGTTEATLQTSIEKVKKSLDKEEQENFILASKIISMKYIGDQMEAAMAGIFSGNTPDKAKVEAGLRNLFNDKTYADIIADADAIMLARLDKDKKEISEKISKLESDKIKSVAEREVLSKIVLTNAVFSKDYTDLAKKWGWTSDTEIFARIKFDIENKTDKALSSVVYKITIKDPRRSIPYYEDSFRGSISGGLEPKEKKKLVYDFDWTSDWVKAPTPAGAQINMSVIAASDANKNIIGEDSFTEAKEQELSRLTKTLSDLNSAGKDWHRAYAQELEENFEQLEAFK